MSALSRRWVKNTWQAFSSGLGECTPLLGLAPSELCRVPSCVGAYLSNPLNEISEHTRAEFFVCLGQL